MIHRFVNQLAEQIHLQLAAAEARDVLLAGSDLGDLPSARRFARDGCHRFFLQ